MKYFYLIAGANGSGKTTFAKELLEKYPDLCFLNSDEIALEINDNLGIKSGKELLKKLDEYLQKNKQIVMESTISGNYHYRILERVHQAGYISNLYYVFLDLVALNISRIRSRVLLGGHNVPKDDIIRRYKRSIKNFWETKNQVNNWSLYHNTNNTFEKIAFGNDEEKILNMAEYNIFKDL